MGSSGFATPSSWQTGAGKFGGKSAKLGGISGQFGGDAGAPLRLGGYLRSLRPDKTAETVAAETGLPADTIAKWLPPTRSAPSFGALLVLAGVYGPAVLAAAYKRPPPWLDAAVAEAERQDLTQLAARIEAQLSKMDRR